LGTHQGTNSKQPSKGSKGGPVKKAKHSKESDLDPQEVPQAAKSQESSALHEEKLDTEPRTKGRLHRVATSSVSNNTTTTTPLVPPESTEEVTKATTSPKKANKKKEKSEDKKEEKNKRKQPKKKQESVEESESKEDSGAKHEEMSELLMQFKGNKSSSEQGKVKVKQEHIVFKSNPALDSSSGKRIFIEMTEERYAEFLRFESMKMKITDEQCIQSTYETVEGAQLVKEEFRKDPYKFSISKVAETIREKAEHPKDCQDEYEILVPESLRKLKNNSLYQVREHFKDNNLKVSAKNVKKYLDNKKEKGAKKKGIKRGSQYDQWLLQNIVTGKTK